MSFFRNKRLFTLFIALIILVVLIGYSLSNRQHLTTFEQFIHDTVAWSQQLVYKPVQFVSDIFSNIGDLKHTYEENKILREKISEYKTLVYEVQVLKKENEELLNLVDKTASIRDYEPIQATVIARSPERWMEHLTIDKGTQDGVELNMAVITAEGMIGKVQRVSPYSSTVQLLTGIDQFNRISATIEREDGPAVYGLIEEYDRESNLLLFKMIDESNTDVEVGEIVVTSGLGGVFPAGLTIGTVKEISPDQYGLTKTALIEPTVDLYDINHVIVVDRSLHTIYENDNEEEEQ